MARKGPDSRERPRGWRRSWPLGSAEPRGSPMRRWINALNEQFPLRYLTWLVCALGFVATALSWYVLRYGSWLVLSFGALTVLGLRDVLQTKRAILRNYPVIGHMRFA